MSETQDKQVQEQPGKGDPGFTPERDRRMILLSCVTLIVMSLIIFWMVQGKLKQLSDVTGAYAQVSFTAADTVRSNSTEMEAGELVAKPSQHTAQWIESSGTVAYVHDKKGDAISWDKPNAALGSVYWLECGLPVTAVKPLAPVAREGEQIRFWGQIAETDVAKLEFSEENGAEIRSRFGLQDGQRIAIFFASEVEATGRSTPLLEEIDELREISDDADAGQAAEGPADGD